jgi:FMN phosphatase YigB (HAD superfamily)
MPSTLPPGNRNRSCLKRCRRLVQQRGTIDRTARSARRPVDGAAEQGAPAESASQERAVAEPDELLFMIDVDDTLLDNDRFGADLTARLDMAFGREERERYWQIYNERRDRLGYADYLGALQTFRLQNADEPNLLKMSQFLLDYPFAERLYPHALAVVRHLRSMGGAIVLSDGDIVFQPRKIQRSGLWDAVDGRVLVYLHKERMLDVVLRHFPARGYVMFDDKPQLLAAMKRRLADCLTTVFVRQGHYAAEAENLALDPAPDMAVDHISDVLGFARSHFEPASMAQGRSR